MLKIIAGALLDEQSYFGRANDQPIAPFVADAEKIERAAAIESHPFFVYAMENSSALLLWAGQEAVITNPFSQALFATLSNIKNVHVRSILIPVVAGEHSPLREGIATRAHPWLIRKLCLSLNLDFSSINQGLPVTAFANALIDSSSNVMFSLGFIGVGNELMLQAEYKAVQSCFEKNFPEADFADFLHSNIHEDEAHTKLIERAATALAALGESGEDFLNGARAGVAARVRYYDQLLLEAQLHSKG